MNKLQLRQLIRENIKQLYEVEYFRDKTALDVILWLNRNSNNYHFLNKWTELGDGLGKKLTIDKVNGDYDEGEGFGYAPKDVRDNWRKYWKLVKAKGGKVQATIKYSDVNLINKIRNMSSEARNIQEMLGTWIVKAEGNVGNEKLEIITPRMLTWDEVGGTLKDKDEIPYEPVKDNPNDLPSEYRNKIDWESIYKK